MTEQTHRSAPAPHYPQPFPHTGISRSVMLGVGLALALSFLGAGMCVGWGTQALVPVALIVGALGDVFWRESLRRSVLRPSITSGTPCGGDSSRCGRITHGIPVRAW